MPFLLPQPKRKIMSLLLTNAAALGLWLYLLANRNVYISTPCYTNHSACDPNQINFLDRVALDFKLGWADYWSFVTQDTAGAIAFVIPLILIFFRKFNGSSLFKYYLALIQAILFNGLINEMLHGLTPRARPFVYHDLIEQSLNPSHYTSFYSGHTSFVAVCMTSLCLGLKNEKMSLINLFIILGLILVILTGLFRVLAGRHFPSDVIIGAVLGFTWSNLSYYFINQLLQTSINIKKTSPTEIPG